MEEAGVNHEKSSLTLSGMTVRRFIILLVTINSAVWMATSIYVPAMPTIGIDLAMSSSQLSASLTLYYICFAALMPVIGPLSDAWGRRRFLLSGLLIFLVGSLSCAFATNAFMFYAGRTIQGFGSAMIQVPAMAMVRDDCRGKTVYSVLGILGALIGIIPVLSMLAGGFITEVWGWRPLFFILAGTSVVISIICLREVPETLPPNRRRTNLDFRSEIKTYRKMIISKQIILVGSPLFFSVAFQGAYLASAPYAFSETLGLSPTQFGVANALVVLGMATGQYTSSRMVKSVLATRLYFIGGLMALVAGCGYGGLIVTANLNIYLIILSLILFAVSFGFMEPIGLKSILTEFEETSGMASALYCSLLLTMQGLGSVVAGTLMGISYPPLTALAIVMVPAGIMIVILARSANIYIR